VVRLVPYLPCTPLSCHPLGPPVAKGLDLEPAARVVDVRRIWDRAPHNAFTDLVRFRDRWFCAFREGRDHVSPDGAIRVITSPDGQEWTSAAHLVSATADLRDPKLTVTPAGRLMLNAVAAGHPPGTIHHQSMTWLSDDGKTWDSGHEVGEPNFWLWRVAWHGPTAYGVGYGTADRKFVKLYRGPDGIG